MIESLLLAVTPILTMRGQAPVSDATGFFFQRAERLFLVTSRHVVLDEASQHCPDQLQIELHVDPDNVAATTPFSIPLYQNHHPVWRQGGDAGGMIDVITLELDQGALPDNFLFYAFTPVHLVQQLEQVEVGTPVLIVGLPLGFHDTLHHLPVARQAVIASAFGIRFQGKGYFLTDARMHRGTSGAPVVVRSPTAQAGRETLAWMLLGVHTGRLDMTNRDVEQDDRLGLNCAWYADILLTLT